MDDALLSARGLALRFGGITALQDVSADLWPGEVLAVVGESGRAAMSIVLPTSDFIGQQVAEFDTRTLLKHAAKQAREVHDVGGEGGVHGVGRGLLWRLGCKGGRFVIWFGRGSLEAAAMKPSELLVRHRDAIRAVVTAHRAGNPRVFGSVALGEDTEVSDLDLLVDSEERMSLFDVGAIVSELGELPGIPVDVATPGALTEAMRGRVLREAVPV